MINTEPLVSILMPVYNGEDYIEEALDSLLNQTYKNYEIIVIDDGSTDSTIDHLSKYDDERIKIEKNAENKGIAYTRNRALGLSGGKYIAWLDCDDVSLPYRIEKQVEFLENNSEYVLCFCNIKSIDSKGNICSKSLFGKKSAPVEWDLVWGNPIPQSAVMLRSDILKENNLQYDPEYPPAEDYHLWTRLVQYGRMARIDYLGVLYRVTEGSAFQRESKKALEQSIKSNIVFIKTLSNEKLPDFHNKLIQFYHALEENKTFYNPIIIKQWIEELLELSSKRWKWNKNEIQAAKKKTETIVLNYLRDTNKKILKKNLRSVFLFGPAVMIKFILLFLCYVFNSMKS